MKPFVYIAIWVFLFISIPACQRHTDYPPAMQQAETLMDTRPDSALHQLQGMADTLTMLPDEAQIYYHLLTIQAKDKQYITHTSDSLINRIVSFYEDSGDKDRLMLAYFYQGSTYRDMNDAPRALKAFQQAVDLDIPNLDLLAKTYNQMGTLFMYQGLHDEVIRVNRKSIELYLLQGKRNKISYFLRDIARMYDIKEEKDSASYYYKEACQTALADGDSARYYGIWGELGGFYYKTGNINEAKQILKQAELSTYIRNKSHIYFALGDIYNHLGLQDSVYHYHTKTLLNNDIRNEYYSHISLYRIEQEKKNYVQALKHIDKALVLKDSIDATTQTEAIAQINALYNYQHIERENNLLALEKEKQKSQMMILLMALMGSASCCIIYFYRQKEKKQKELDVEKLLRYIAEDNYESSQKTISQKKAEIKNLNIQLKEAQENNPPLKEKELRLMNLQTSSIYKEFKQAANDESVNLISVKNQNKWKELEEAINKAYPNFTKQLNLVCPNLSEKEMQVCLLTKLKIQPSGIAIILKCSRQSITNIRTRIHKKIQLEGKEYSKINHFIDEI